MRTIAIFGATGRTGRLVVELALAEGYAVRALARDPSKLAAQAGLTVIAGDVGDPVTIEETIAGADAVLSVIGHVQGSPPHLQELATRNIVEAMRACGVQRVVSLTNNGIHCAADRVRWRDRLVQAGLSVFLRDPMRDAQAHVEVLASSGLDWVVVRAARLTDGPAVAHPRVGYLGPGAASAVPRATVATFLLSQLQDDRFVHDFPLITA